MAGERNPRGWHDAIAAIGARTLMAHVPSDERRVSDRSCSGLTNEAPGRAAVAVEPVSHHTASATSSADDG